MKTILRTAHLSDLPKLKELEQKLIQFERPFDNTIPIGKVRYYNLKKLLQSDNAKCLVVEVDNNIIGCGFGKTKKNPEWPKNQKTGYIGLMFLEEKHRQQGWGNQIITSLLEWFKEQQIKDIRLKVYAENDVAMRAYQKYGFKNFMTEMRYSQE